MKKKSLMIGLGILVLAGALSCADVYANNFSRRLNHKGGAELDGMLMKKTHVILRNAKELGLADDKVAAIKNLELDTRKVLIKQNAEIEIVDLDIQAKLHASPVDIEAVNKLVDQKYDLKKAEDKVLVEAFAKLKGLLTAEQFDKLHEFWKRGEGKGSDDRGMRDGRGEGDETGEHSRRP